MFLPLFSKGRTPSPIFLLFLFYFFALIIAAIGTPLIFNWVVQWNRQSPNPLNAYLLRKGFVIFFERIRLIAVLCFLPVIWRMYHGIYGEKLGFGRKNFRLFFAFFVFGGLLVGGIFAIKMVFLNFRWEVLPAFSLVRAFAGALLIGVLEEWLFRGIIFKFLLDEMRPSFAFILSAFIFAYFHFRPTYSLSAVREATFSDGFFCLYEVIFHSLAGISWFKFAIIFSLGYLLAAIYFRTGKLSAAMGFHGGIIFSLTIFKGSLFFSGAHVFLGSNDLFDSPLALAVIILTIIFNKWQINSFMVFPRRNSQP
ncbi:MAG: CPBP family intramembrane metalloprotease [Puniceicoccales bacterium]|jgi:membrane protease YdiL (CAAX protease family)|nr:CPBP family intramembrane metalloprotease [Puniceicoccales bacterium]